MGGKSKLIVGVVGTANTGKTTFIQDVVSDESNGSLPEELKWRVYGKDYRDEIAKRGLKINRNGDEAGQLAIHEVLLGNIRSAMSETVLKRMIMDRTILDSFAYTYWHSRFGKGGISEKTLMGMWEDVNRYSMVFDSIIYIPMDKCGDIAVVDDGVRDVDEQYRREIDHIFNALWYVLLGSGAKMEIIYGSREERLRWFFQTKVYLMETRTSRFNTLSKFDKIMEDGELWK